MLTLIFWEFVSGALLCLVGLAVVSQTPFAPLRLRMGKVHGVLYAL